MVPTPGAVVDEADRDPCAIGCAPPGDRHPTTASAPMGNLESSGCTLSLAPTRSCMGPHMEGTSCRQERGGQQQMWGGHARACGVHALLHSGWADRSGLRCAPRLHEVRSMDTPRPPFRPPSGVCAGHRRSRAPAPCTRRRMPGGIPRRTTRHGERSGGMDSRGVCAARTMPRSRLHRHSSQRAAPSCARAQLEPERSRHHRKGKMLPDWGRIDGFRERKIATEHGHHRFDFEEG